MRLGRRAHIAGTRWATSAAVALPIYASAAETASGPSWSFDENRPTLTSADGRFSMAVRARLQVDAGAFHQPSDVGIVTPLNDVELKHLDSRGLVRRAYLGIEGRAFRDLWYEYRMDFGGAGFRFAEPFIHLARISYNVGGYDAGRLLRFNAGLIKPIFTYDDATSSASLTFLERAAVVNVATTAYGGGAPRLGAELTFQNADLLRSGDNLVLSGALTGHIASSRGADIPGETAGHGTHMLGRIAYRLWSDGASNVQVGGSASHTLSVGDGGGPGGLRGLILQDQPEIRVDGNGLVGTGPLPAEGGDLWGLETAANLSNLYFAAEYYRFGVDLRTDCDGCANPTDPTFSGWYFEGSWVVTGEAKIYQPNATNNGYATYANPQVDRPFGNGGWGAWEIAARYSDLDLNWRPGAPGTVCRGISAGCIRGGEQKIWSLGLNWYLNDSLRLLVDYMIVDVDKLDSSGAQVGQVFTVIGTRFQLTN